MLLDIVILPPVKIRKMLAHNTVEVCKKYPTYYVVDNKRLIPHISLFHLRTSKRRILSLCKAVKGIIKNLPTQRIILKKLRYYAWGDGPTCALNRPERLVALNRAVVAACAPFRIGTMPWRPDRAPTPSEKNKRRLYGVHYCIGEAFKPHITLAKLRKKGDAKLVVKKIRNLDFSFPVNEISICQVNSGHQVIQLIKRFRV